MLFSAGGESELVEPEEPFAQRGIWRQHTGETFDHLAACHVQVEHDRGLSGLLPNLVEKDLVGILPHLVGPGDDDVDRRLLQQRFGNRAGAQRRMLDDDDVFAAGFRFAVRLPVPNRNVVFVALREQVVFPLDGEILMIGDQPNV